MLSRIMWGFAALAALVGGMVLQGDDPIFVWDRDGASAVSEQSIDARVDRAIDSSFDKMQVVGSDGEEVDVPAKTKRAMADAVGRLVKAEADLAMARVGEDDQEAIAAAQARRNQARADIDRLKAEIKRFERAAQSENDVLRDQIRSEIRQDVRDTIRDAPGTSGLAR